MKRMPGDGAKRELLAELAPWLVTAALADWLLLRTFSRTAIFMPKTPLLAEVFFWIGRTGQLAANAATLLALICLGWIVWREGQDRSGLPLAAALAGLLTTSTLFIFTPPGGWLVVAQLLLVASLGLLLLRLWQWGWPGLALLPGGGALLLAGLHQTLPGRAGSAFQLGELLAVVAPVALWWAYGRDAGRRVYLLALLLALLFAAVYLRSPSMTGTIAVWSMGLTLYLPWWVYALGLWAAVIVLWRTLSGSKDAERGIAYGLLLLAAGGYAPQLSVHQFLGVIGFYLLITVNSASVAALQRVKSVPMTATFPGSPSRATPPA
ncbi:MAG: hypothetical protein HY328_14745 [Chloroflexi bacterium]|nr:hypothetical protein [Chloroflexota bacterium]